MERSATPFSVLSLILWVSLPGWVSSSFAELPSKSVSSSSLESVRGTGCYTYGDNETPAHAKRAAMTIAQEQAVRTHRVFVQSASKVKNFQLEEDVIQTASAAMLQNIQVEKEEKRAQEICITISAMISPVSMEELIRQRVNAKDISHTAQSVLSQSSSFGARLWTNKSGGQYVEGERLIIYVQSDRDAYLKLDYFQADGTVVHMVPNKFRGQAFVNGGRTYAFGDDSAPEHFIIQGPFGAETIKAIFSVRPFDMALHEASPISDSRTYLQVLSGSRGLGVEGTSHSVSLTTVSKAVEEYKKARMAPSSEKAR